MTLSQLPPQAQFLVVTTPQPIAQKVALGAYGSVGWCGGAACCDPIGGRYVKRKLGEIRQPGTREGLTRKQAEAALRRQMAEVRVVVPEERMSFQEAGDRYLHHLEHVRNRKPSTLQDYRIIHNKHLVPHFGPKTIDRIVGGDVASYIAAKSASQETGRTKAKGSVGLSRKTIVNHLNFAHGVFAFALRRGWCTTNPVAETDRPQIEQTDPDIRFLTLTEFEALLRVAEIRAALPVDREEQPDVRAAIDQALYLTAAMAGLREGEMIALRWRDVDWSASLIRVFCHPQTGAPYDASQLRKRFYEAMQAAGMGHRCGREGGITFHSLRHTFGTRMAAAGVPMRTLQEWMGHRNLTTTEIYADYAPDPAYGAAFAEAAFAARPTENESQDDHHETEKAEREGEKRER